MYVSYVRAIGLRVSTQKDLYLTVVKLEDATIHACMEEVEKVCCIGDYHVDYIRGVA